MKTSKLLACASVIALSVGFSGPLLADVSVDDINNDATTTNDVVTNGLGTQGQRYSPLKTVNKDNVGSLVPAWAMSLGGEKQRGQESQPLIKDGVMYVTGSYSRIWRSTPKPAVKSGSTMPSCQKASCLAATWSTVAPPCTATRCSSARSMRSS